MSSIVAGIVVLAVCGGGAGYVWAGKRAEKEERERQELQNTGENPHAKWI